MKVTLDGSAPTSSSQKSDPNVLELNYFLLESAADRGRMGRGFQHMTVNCSN